MDPSLNLPRERPLSNSILKSRPKRVRKVERNTNHQTNLPVGLDDVVPLQDPQDAEGSNLISNKPTSSITTDFSDGPVRFREVKSCPTTRNNIFECINEAKKQGHHENEPDKMFFYVTSSVLDDDSNSYSSSEEQPLSQEQQSNIFFANIYRLSDLSVSSNELDHVTTLTSKERTSMSRSSIIDDVPDAPIVDCDDESGAQNQTTVYLDRVQQNSSNLQCADCDSENPTIAITSWLMVVCRNCAAIHKRITADFLDLQSLVNNIWDWDLIDLLQEYGNRFANSLLENDMARKSKPTINSSEFEREQYIRKKYIEKIYFQPYNLNSQAPSKNELNKLLYENVETTNYGNTLRLIMSGADPNYSEKKFLIADHAQRHHQTKQMKLILANGGLIEFEIDKMKSDDIREAIVHLSNKHGVLKGFLTRFQGDHLNVHAINPSSGKSQRSLFQIDLNNILAIWNQTVNAVTLKCRLRSSSVTHTNSQCTMMVDDQTSSSEYIWVFSNDLERSLWLREIMKRQYSYHQLLSTDFILLMKLNIQEGITAEKQQVVVIISPGRFVIYSDTIFDEVDLRKYLSLTYQKNKEFTGIVLCLVGNRFLYLSSPITKLIEILYSCLRKAIKVKTLTNLNEQILTSQNIPVIVGRSIDFLFEHGLQSIGLYRIAGQETKIRQLLSEFLADPYTTSLTRENYTEHDVATALKRFLRQLDTPLIGTRKNYQAWLRSIADKTISSEQLIQHHRALLRDLKANLPIHYSTLRTMLMHINTVAMLSQINSMTLQNLIATLTPCLISDTATISTNPAVQKSYNRQISFDDMDMPQPVIQDKSKHNRLSSVDSSASMSKLLRNRSSSHESLASASTLSQVPLSSAYKHVIPSIEANFEILTNLCKHYRELFDVTDDEFEHERNSVEMLLSMQNNPSIPHKLDGAMVSAYFESRADEFNGYAMYILEKEATADTIIEKLLKQINKEDCFFWALFEVIIDQNLERPMYSCENIGEVLYRYRTYLSHELNRHATFVVKLNYLQFEKERLVQQRQNFNNRSVQCEYFDLMQERWLSCVWIFERAILKIYRALNNSNDKASKSKPNLSVRESGLNVAFDPHTPTYSWHVEEIYLYIGADCRFVEPFDMNEYRVLTVLPPDIIEINPAELPFGVSFRFADRDQMFSWYFELSRIIGHDKWTRRAPRTLPDGINYMPLQNYHASPTTASRRRREMFKNRFINKGCHVASNVYKQLRK